MEQFWTVLERFRKHLNISQFLRSGAERFWMGTPLEHCNFSSHSLFPSSAPLRATIIRTFPSCYGAERNAFDTDGKHHLNIAISQAIHYFPAPLRATIIGTSTWTVPSSYGAERNAFGWEHHLNIAISLAIQYLPSPLRSVPQSLVQAVPTERSGTLLDGNTTWTLQFL